MIYPKQKAWEREGTFPTDGDHTDVTAIWCSEDIAVRVCNRHLWINGEYYRVPPSENQVWVINGNVLSSKGARLTASREPAEIAKRIASSLVDEYEQKIGKITIVVKECIFGSAGSVVDENNWVWGIGEHLFSAKQGNLWFRGKMIGHFHPGDKVVAEGSVVKIVHLH